MESYLYSATSDIIIISQIDSDISNARDTKLKEKWDSNLLVKLYFHIIHIYV